MIKFCLFLSLAVSFALQAEESGKLIAFAGISGAGKSTLAQEISTRCDGTLFSESEEASWPFFIRVKQPYGEVSSFLVFRAMRVHGLWEAWNLRKQGKIAVVDSYYEKITYHYLGKEGMEWLLATDDPYFSCIQEITKLDSELLPDADCIVFVDVSFEDWVKMLQDRGRARDSIEGFQESYQKYRAYVFDAVHDLAAKRNTKVVIFSQQYGDIHEQGEKLQELLKKEEVL